MWLISYEEQEGSTTKSPLAAAQSLNFSVTGAQFEIVEALPVPCRLEMEIAIKDHIFSVRGKVIYCRKALSGRFHVGIHFDSPAEDIFEAVSDEGLAHSS